MADTIHPQYEVGTMTKAPEPDGAGGFHDVWTVPYTTASGIKSHVKLPATHLTAANVHSLIAHEHRHITAVQNLGHGAPPPEPPAA